MYQQATVQAMLCELAVIYGHDPYIQWVVCDGCGLLQVYQDDESDDPHGVYRCPGFEEVGCGSETCITVAHYEEAA